MLALPVADRYQGQDHPHDFYGPANLKRLWDGLSSGDAPGMTCHPTDPAMAEFEGYEKTADRKKTAECMGALTLLGRELTIFERHTIAVDTEAARDGTKPRAGEAYRRYKRERGKAAMTIQGLAAFAMRVAFVMPGHVPVPALPLTDDEIGYPPLPLAPALAALVEARQ